MNREDIQREFRQQTQEPIMTLNKCEVSANSKYVIWLEKRILGLSIPSVNKRSETYCDYCAGSGWDSYPNHSTTLAPCPKCQP